MRGARNLSVGMNLGIGWLRSARRVMIEYPISDFMDDEVWRSLYA